MLLPTLQGELAGLLAGQQEVQGTVAQVRAGQATVALPGGEAVQVPTVPGLQAGASLVMRVRQVAQGVMLQVVRVVPPGNSPAGGAASTPPADAAPGGGGAALILSRAAGADGPGGASSALLLQPGQEVTARVIGQTSPGRVQVQIQGAVLEARTDGVALPMDRPLRLQVQQFQPDVVLRMVETPTAAIAEPETPAIAAAVREAQPLPPPITLPGGAAQRAVLVATLNENQPSAKVGQAIQAVLQEAEQPTAGPALQALAERVRQVVPQGETLTAEQVRGLVRDGGLQFEARGAAAGRVVPGREAEAARAAAPADLKGMVMQALAETASAPAQASQQATHATALLQYLQSIETQQTANLLALSRGEPVLLQLPLLSASGQVTTASVAIHNDATSDQRPGRNGQRTSSGYGMLFHLELENIGAVRIDAQFAPSGARVVFYAESAAGRARLQAELGGLSRKLREVGKGPVLVAVRPLGDLPAQRRAEFQALETGLPQSGSGLDVRA